MKLIEIKGRKECFFGNEYEERWLYDRDLRLEAFFACSPPQDSPLLRRQVLLKKEKTQLL